MIINELWRILKLVEVRIFVVDAMVVERVCPIKDYEYFLFFVIVMDFRESLSAKFCVVTH